MFGYSSMFSANFAKGNNFLDFLFASLEDETIPTGSLLSKERVCSYEIYSFLYGWTPSEMGGKLKIKELLPL